MTKTFRLFQDGAPCDGAEDMALLLVRLADLYEVWRTKGPNGEPWSAVMFARAVGYASRDGLDDALRAIDEGKPYTLGRRLLETIANNPVFPEPVRRLARLCLLRRVVQRAFQIGALLESTAGTLFTPAFLAQFEEPKQHS